MYVSQTGVNLNTVMDFFLRKSKKQLFQKA